MPATKTKQEKDRDLDKSLEQSFPASDPMSTNKAEDKPTRPMERKPAEIEKSSVDALAKEASRKNRSNKD
jgi:hypothetical protein